MIGIVVALPDEGSSLSHRKLTLGQCIQLTDQILLMCSGIGAENARQASQQLIDKGVTRLISWGCAAALDSQLQAGDLVIPKILHCIDHQELSIDNPWRDHALTVLSALNPRTEKLIESTKLVAQSTDKQTLYQSTQAIALDMESVAIANIAITNNIPILVIRAIADPASMSLPQAISYALNQQGLVNLPRLLRFIACHPGEIPALAKLGLHFQQAKNKLKCVAKQLDIIVGFDQKTAHQ